MTAATACRTCGTAPLENARFCHGCGAPVHEMDVQAEYKQVTVLFADVVRSMAIATAVGPERLREIMAELVSRSADVVRRYGGTMDKFTGDGLMAVFGAPVTLEDHAIRACLAAMGIQSEARQLADEVHKCDGVALQVRVGLNSGQVIAGEIGSGVGSYTAIGEHVGLAQRMESVAAPGSVVLSESTAHLVGHIAVLGEPQLVHTKDGADIAVRQLSAIEPRHHASVGPETRLFGRNWEIAAVEAILNRTIDGRGGAIGVVGPPGIGKSRIAREAAALAVGRGAEVFWTFCESHASDIPFNALTRLIRATSGIAEFDAASARAQVRDQIPGADSQDLLLLEDLLGIADPGTRLPQVTPDARRRRLTTMINAAALARTEPALYIIEDVQWMDEASESMLADFFTVIPQTPSMMLITYRPEYDGALSRVHGAQTIALVPLGDSECAELVGELLGHDPSVAALASTIVSRVGGNPFFAEEMVRDLAERGVLDGHPGAYACRTDVAAINVPATLQATIGARIDRLDRQAKRALCAAAVIGSRFDTDLLTDLEVEPRFDELIKAELIDQVRFTPQAEYAFRHPLIRTVAYESQLKSDRAEMHRRLAKAIEKRYAASLDENAAQIAEHLEAAGEGRAAYAWHMRAGPWLTSRDNSAARLSWERARQIADALPDDDPDRTAMRIAPRAMLCGYAGLRGPVSKLPVNFAEHFDQLRELCALTGDSASLVLGMMGMIATHLVRGRHREASALASEQLALTESAADPIATVGAASVGIAVKYEAGEMADILRWTQTVIDAAAGGPTEETGAYGNVIMASPLPAAVVWRGIARCWLGRRGWREDLDQAAAMAQGTDPVTYSAVVQWRHRFAIPNGVLRHEDSTVCELDEALRIAHDVREDTSLAAIKRSLGVVLAHSDDAADRRRGLELLEEVRELCLSDRFFISELPLIDLYIALEQARRGDPDGAIPVMRKALDEIFARGQPAYGVAATGVLVETLLDRGTDSGLSEARTAIDRLANVPMEGSVVRDIWLLRLRALLARARGDEDVYQDLVERYREMAKSLGFEGHIAMADAM